MPNALKPKLLEDQASDKAQSVSFLHSGRVRPVISVLGGPDALVIGLAEDIGLSG
jgi:hypothetical protein